MSCDIDRKKMGIARDKAEDDYFSARPQIDCNDRRKVFEAGFELAWNARQKGLRSLNSENYTRSADSVSSHYSDH